MAAHPNLYHYVPSVVAAGIFLGLFFMSTLLHTFQMVRGRSWICIPIVLGGCCEWIGYIGRIIGHIESPDYELPAFILQAILLLIGPSFIAATIYMILGRVILLTDGEDVALIRKERLTKLFVTGDVLCFLIQAGGGGTQSSDKQSMRDVGKYVVLVGLGLQLILFGIFVFVATHFHFKIRQNPRPASTSSQVSWSKHMFMMYAVSVLIFIRCVFRIVEYSQGFDGYLFSHEAYLYCLDGLPILLAIVLVNIVHPHDITQNLKKRQQYHKGHSSESGSESAVAMV